MTTPESKKLVEQLEIVNFDAFPSDVKDCHPKYSKLLEIIRLTAIEHCYTTPTL
jgi:hypothetical protein